MGTLHTGTPVLVYNNLKVFHGYPTPQELRENKIRRRWREGSLWLFDPSEVGAKKSYGLPSIWTIHEGGGLKLLDGQEFDPKGVLKYDWKELVSKGVLVDDDWTTKTLPDISIISKLPNLLGVHPKDWQEVLKDAKPVKCDVHVNGGKVRFKDWVLSPNIHGGELNSLEVSNWSDTGWYGGNEGWIKYDPDKTDADWAKTTRENVQKALDLYKEEAVKRVFEQTKKRNEALLMQIDNIPGPGGAQRRI